MGARSALFLVPAKRLVPGNVVARLVAAAGSLLGATADRPKSVERPKPRLFSCEGRLVLGGSKN